jgi:tetratricopeptide (TPR) repeat protein
MFQRLRLTCFAILLMAVISACSRKQETLANTTHDGRLAPMLKNLGDLHHPVSTKSGDAQRYFNQGLTLVYGFNHAEAIRSFKEAARLDPNLAMAYWGQALALAPNINDPAIGPDREQQGQDAISEALKRKNGATEAEQALIDALAARFTGGKERDRAALNKSYAEAMTKVHERFPDDPDVSALYADAVMNTMPWDYWTKSGKPKPGIAEARAAIENSMSKHPSHAGINHLYIHLMEASAEVDRAVPSADRLGGLVPAAGHLVHMPAHIYIRVGRYADAASVNVKAISADEDYITQCRAQGIYPAAYYPHNIHFLNAVLAMDGRSSEALDSARKVAGHHDHATMHEPGFGFAHLLKTIPLLTMVRFGHWDDILNEPQPPADQKFGNAMRHFARGYAQAAKGNAAEAQRELEELRKLSVDPAIEELKIFDLNSLGTLAKIAASMLDAEVARRAGKHDRAIAAYRKAVELDDALLYSEPPDWMLVPRHYLGEALLAAGRAKDAESIYREDLNRHRNNGWSLVGLEQSLRKQGRIKEADETAVIQAKSWARADIKLPASRF